MANMSIDEAIELGLRCLSAGQFQQAESVYRQILAAQPSHPDALHMLGVSLFQMRRLGEAEEFARRAIGINPLSSDYFRALGQILATAGKLPEAVIAFRSALGLVPDSPQAANDLGSALLQSGQASEAVQILTRATTADPQFFPAWLNLGNALRLCDQIEQAITAYRKSVEIEPGFAEGFYNLGNLLRQTGRLNEAIEAYEAALKIRPRSTDTLVNLGTALREAGRFDDATISYQRAISLQPKDTLAHANLGLMLLLNGDYEHGWAEYEWRGQVERAAKIHQEFNKPRWDGTELNGQAILLHAEQGFGDTIQMSRYVPMVVARGGKAVLQCQDELVQLLKESLDGVQVISRQQPLPTDFAVHCPLLSLPGIFKTTLESIPSTPYLRVDRIRSADWKAKLLADRYKVGLAWGGSFTYAQDRHRSIPLEMLTPLAVSEQVQWVSLQKPKPATMPTLGNVLDRTDELKDFAETAALIENLDLVITVDTAVAHLAGALGKPTWILIPFVPDWRWLLERNDSPWYPSARLFRQGALGDWQTPINQIAAELKCRI